MAKTSFRSAPRSRSEVRSGRPGLAVRDSSTAFQSARAGRGGLTFLLALRIRRQGWRRGLKVWGFRTAAESSRVDFYERLIALLEKRGAKRPPHQTPLEFASLVGMSEALAITQAYNRVRYGAEKLSASERKRIE